MRGGSVAGVKKLYTFVGGSRPALGGGNGAKLPVSCLNEEKMLPVAILAPLVLYRGGVKTVILPRRPYDCYVFAAVTMPARE